MLKIFLVEDHGVTQHQLGEFLLQVDGAQIAGIATGEEAAVAWLHTNRLTWDLAIVDLLLANGSGLRVLSSCRVRSPHQHMVVLSNHLSKKVRRRCLDFGANAVFDKTADLEDLLVYCASLSRARPMAFPSAGGAPG